MDIEGAGEGSAVQGHDIVLGKNVKHAGEEQAVRGHDIVVGKHFEGGRRRAVSNTNTGTSSSSAPTNVRDTLVKRKSIQERQSDMM